MSPPKTFSGFLGLPQEIQDVIWGYAMECSVNSDAYSKIACYERRGHPNARPALRNSYTFTASHPQSRTLYVHKSLLTRSFYTPMHVSRSSKLACLMWWKKVVKRANPSQGPGVIRINFALRVLGEVIEGLRKDIGDNGRHLAVLPLIDVSNMSIGNNTNNNRRQKA